MKRSIVITLIVLIWLAPFFCRSQTTLSAGDIAIIGLNSNTPDDFAFVLLVDVESGTEIHFTDNGWTGSALRTTEGTDTWTASIAKSAGTVIPMSSLSMNFSTSGDQILAYQGSSGSPTFIYAVNNRGSGWQSGTTNSNDSALPTGLTDGATAVALIQANSNIYDQSVTSGTRAELLAAISDPANWTGNSANQTLPSGSYAVLTSGSNDTDSYVDGNGLTQPNPGSIAASVDTPGEAIDAFKFNIKDTGSSDGLTTKVTQITIKPGTNDNANWANLIQGVTLSGNTLGSITLGTTTIEDNSIVIPITSGNLNVCDGGTEIITLAFYLNTAGLTDAVFQFMIDADAPGFNADFTGSTFAATFSGGDVSSNQISLSIVATELRFAASQPPSSVAVDTDFTVTVRATDSAGNIDASATHSVTLSKGSGSGTLSSATGLSQSLDSGSYTWSDVRYNTEGTFTISASATGLTGATTGSITATSSSIPAGYYDAAVGLCGTDLKAALHTIIRTTHTTQLSYTGLWDALKDTDEDPANSSNVLLLYTGWSYPKSSSGGGVSDWNREHTWANSHGIDDGLPGYADAHHLRPTDVTVNSARGSLDFDEGGTEYVDSDGATGCLRDGDSWEPRDEVKGDVARMMFYMATRYEGTDTSYDLELSDDPAATSPSGEELGKLSTLRQWHIDDPVSNWERSRNDKICSNWQGNRNPYIDHPEYVDLIWGAGCTSTTIVRMTNASATVNEDGTSYSLNVSIVNPDGTNATTVEVALTGGSGTAADIGNYSSPQTVTFPPGSSANQTVTVTITDDAELEGAESLVFTLQNASGGNSAAIGSPSQFTLTINDNESLPSATTVQFQSASGSVAEDGASFSLTLTITNEDAASATTCEVAFTAGSPSGEALTVDIGSYATTGVTFPAGSSTNQTVSLTITDDVVVESNETFTFTIQHVSGGNSASVGATAQFVLTINDNDDTGGGGGACDADDLFISEYIEGSSYNKAIEIFNGTGSAVDLSDYKVQKDSNGNGSFTTETTLSGSLADGDVYILGNISAGSAISSVADLLVGSQSDGTLAFNGDDQVRLVKNGNPIDHIGVPGDVSYAENVTMVRKSSVSAPTTTYDTDEWDTYSTDTFTYLGAHTCEGSGAPATVVQFTSASGAIAEAGGSHTLTLSITNPSATTATTVDVALTGGTGTNADINTYATTEVEFAAGSSANETVALTITDDILAEGDETLVFSLQNVGGGESARLGSPAQYTLTITDNETVVQLTSSGTTKNEGDGSVTITASITNPSPTTAAVVQLVLTGSAADVDGYTTQTLTFPAGSSVNQSATVTITDDAVVESDETFTFTLGNESGGTNVTLGTPTVFILTITDNDEPPELIINEIMQNPANVADEAGEWFEIHNAGGTAQDINGWTISDNGTDSHTINQSVIVQPGGFVVLCINDDTAANGGFTCDYKYTDITLANDDDEIILKDSSSVLIDSVAYDGGAAFPDPDGASMMLVDPSSDNNVGGNWKTSYTDILTASGNDLGTPGLPNIPRIIINELMINPNDPIDVDGEWVELYNAENYPVILTGWSFEDDFGDQIIIAESTRADLTIGANSYVVLCANSTAAGNCGVTCAYDYNRDDFMLGNDGDEVVLKDLNGSEADRVDYPSSFEDPSGKTKMLNNPLLDNNNIDNWSSAPDDSLWDGNCGDKGTPGESNYEPTLLPFAIEGITTDVQNSSVIIAWTTTEPALCTLLYGPTTDYAHALDLTAAALAHTATLADLLPETEYHYRIVAVNSLNFAVLSSPDMVFTIGPWLAVEDDLSGLPKKFGLSQNYPNPFNPTTTINFRLPVAAKVSLNVYNVTGQLVKSLVNDQLPPGEHVVSWNGTTAHNRAVSSGVYFYELRCTGDKASYVSRKRMVFLE